MAENTDSAGYGKFSNHYPAFQSQFEDAKKKPLSENDGYKIASLLAGKVKAGLIAELSNRDYTDFASVYLVAAIVWSETEELCQLDRSLFLNKVFDVTRKLGLFQTNSEPISRYFTRPDRRNQRLRLLMSNGFDEIAAVKFLDWLSN